MTTSGSGSGKQAALSSAMGKTTRAPAAPVVGYVPAPEGADERDLMNNCLPAEHMMMDGFTWHSISCACKNCVRNDYKFMITFNRPDFRHYL
jgi:hypothetical protein